MTRGVLYGSLSAALLGLFCMTGCHYGTKACVDHNVCQVGFPPLDVSPASPDRPGGTGASSPGADLPVPSSQPLPQAPVGQAVQPVASRQVGYENDERRIAVTMALAQGVADAPTQKAGAFEIPKALPGSGAPPIKVPPLRPGETPQERRSEIEGLYEGLPKVEGFAGPQPVPGQAPLSLEELQCTAMSRSPILRQAAADVEAARGTAIQAGLASNPHVGYQGDTHQHGPHRRLPGPRHQLDGAYRRQVETGQGGGLRGLGDREACASPHPLRPGHSGSHQLLRGAGGLGESQGQPGR